MIKLQELRDSAAAVGAVHDAAIAQNFEDHQNDVRRLNDGVGAVANGRIARMAGSGPTEAEIKKIKEKEFFQYVLQKSLEEQIEWHLERARWYEEQAKILREKIAENTEKQNEHYAYAEKFSDLIEEYKRTKKIDTDAAWRLLKERGIYLNKNADPEAFLKVFEDQRQKELKRGGAYEEANDLLRDKAEKYEARGKEHQEEAKQKQHALEEINASSLPENEKTAEKQKIVETVNENDYLLLQDESAAEIIAKSEDLVVEESEIDSESKAVGLSFLQNQFQTSSAPAADKEPVPDDNSEIKPEVPKNNLSMNMG